jgi:hypothetical protein
MFLMIRPPGRPKEVVVRCDATIQGDMLLVTTVEEFRCVGGLR